jgi:hypothetical protein
MQRDAFPFAKPRTGWPASWRRWSLPGTFRLTGPVVQRKLRERHGAQVPWDELAISPAAMCDSPALQTVP